ILGPVIAGPVSDWAEKRMKSGRLVVTLLSLIVSPLCAVAVYTTDSLVMFYVFFTAFSIATTMWLPPIYASLVELVLPRMRGMVTSFYMLSITLIGQGIGPYAVGLMSDRNGGEMVEAILSLYRIGVPNVEQAAVAIWRYRMVELHEVGRTREGREPVKPRLPSAKRPPVSSSTSA